MNKSLTPLIVLFALIILATIIIANTQKPKPVIEYDQSELLPEMKLSPFAKRKRREDRQTHVTKPRRAIVSPNLDILLRDARTDLDAGKVADAEDKLRTLLVFDPENFAALSMLGGIFYYSGRYKEAEMIYRKQSQLHPDDATVYNNLGSALAKQRRFQEAITATEKVLLLDPDSATAILNLSGMHSAIGETDTSVEYFKRAYEKVGDRILPLTFDPTLDNIRENAEFKQIIKQAQQNQEKDGDGSNTSVDSERKR